MRIVRLLVCLMLSIISLKLSCSLVIRTPASNRLIGTALHYSKPAAAKVNKPVPRQKPQRVKPDPDACYLDTKDRPFTLPSGLHRPKQSLGQNYLSDQNYVLKICDAFHDTSEEGSKVVEIGPGMGALTRVLVKRYPKMTGIEIDQRSVRFLNDKLPELNVLHQDVLQTDWAQLAADKGGPLGIVANLPYHITSQVLFSLADSYKAIEKAVVTMQLECAQRIVAKPNTKPYGIPSVVFQLYGATHINFHIPPTVFYPVPKVDSALLTIDFTKPHKDLHRVEGEHLRKYVCNILWGYFHRCIIVLETSVLEHVYELFFCLALMYVLYMCVLQDYHHYF
jgi:16S rRNA (adenine1518-N6/adenine1519-N6)-dimethyltransferase